MRVLVSGLVLVGMVLIASPTCAQQRGPVNPRRPATVRPSVPTSSVAPDGRTWERIQLQYVDARAVAAVLSGVPIVPTELDLWRQSVGMTGGFGFGGSGYGGLAGGYGVAGAGFGGGFGAGSFLGGGAGYLGASAAAQGYSGGYGVIADPNTNALIFGRGRSTAPAARLRRAP